MSSRLSVVFYIILCLEIGIVLTLLPWIPQGFLGLSDWGNNYFLLYAARKTGSDRRIPIRPKLPFHPAACPNSGRVQPTTPDAPTSASDDDDNATRTRRKWGELLRGESMVAWPPVELRVTFQHSLVPLPDIVLRQYLSRPRSPRATWNLFDCARPQSFSPKRGGKEYCDD